MSFTVATAIARLESGPKNLLLGLSPAQRLHRINEVLGLFYELGTWQGLLVSFEATTSGGILTLPSIYQNLQSLGIPSLNCVVQIHGQKYVFSPGGPLPQDWTISETLVALDLGDSTIGQKRYQITGNVANIDSLTFLCYGRKRFSWITDLSTTVIPDSYSALSDGVRALAWKDEGDGQRYESNLGMALKTLNGNLQETTSTEQQVQVDAMMGMGSMQLVH